MALYNLRSMDGEWRISKFTNDLDVESSYTVSEGECSCPAGFRPSCRHRQILPKMLAVGAEDSGLFYDFDNDQFLEPIASAASSNIVDDIPFTETETPADHVVELRTHLASERSDTESLHIGDNWRDIVRSAPTIETTDLTVPHPSIGPIKRRI